MEIATERSLHRTHLVLLFQSQFTNIEQPSGPDRSLVIDPRSAVVFEYEIAEYKVPEASEDFIIPA